MGNNLDIPASLQSQLDAIGSTRGSVLYRGASGWAALGPGPLDYVLQTGGSGADPSWVAASGGGGGGGVVVAIKSATKTDIQTTTATNGTWVDVTGLSISHAPSSAANNVLVRVALTACGTPATSAVALRLMRDATPLGVGDSGGGSRFQATATQLLTTNGDAAGSICAEFLDSPGTTSSITYKVQACGIAGGGGTTYINRTQSDTNAAYIARTSSTLTIAEVLP